MCVCVSAFTRLFDVIHICKVSQEELENSQHLLRCLRQFANYL